MMMRLPEEFDIDIYRSKNEDLITFDDTMLRAHYHSYGRREGRICNQIVVRGNFLDLIPDEGSLLEIGPFHGPLGKRRKGKVSYLDALTTEQLRAKATRQNLSPEDVPDIDYVWHGESYRELIGDLFEVVFSSHNIEHQPNFIGHLRDVASVLVDGGLFYLVVPDKRFCFDHYLALSTIADILEAHVMERRSHAVRHMIEHSLFLAHNDHERHWAGEHGADPFSRPRAGDVLKNVMERIRSAQKNGEYFDAHAWHFTPEIFRYLADALFNAGLSDFEVVRVYPTIRPYAEFYAVLRKAR